MDLDEDIICNVFTDDVRSCCLSTPEQPHTKTCKRMIALDESFKQDAQRHIYGYTLHTASVLHNRKLEYDKAYEIGKQLRDGTGFY